MPEPEFQLPSVVAGGGAVAEYDEGLAAFQAEIGDDKLPAAPGLPTIRIDHKAGVFSVAGVPEQHVEGYVLHYFQTRSWWKSRPQEGVHSPPDCWSTDMLRPDSSAPQRQSEACYSCELAQWGSGPQGSGQACRTLTWVFLLNPAFGSPMIRALLLPPSSIRDFLGTQMSPGYVGRAAAYHEPGKPAAKYFPLVWSRWSLEKGGDLHWIATAEPVAVCRDPRETSAIGKARREFLAQMEAMRSRTASVDGDSA